MFKILPAIGALEFQKLSYTFALSFDSSIY